MAKSLTRKQSKFTDEYIKTGNGTRSALTAYDTEDPNTAGKIANENLNNPKIQNAISQALGKLAINEDTIAGKIAEGLEAKKIAFNFETKSFEVINYPDYNIQHKYLTALIDILGVKAPEKHQHKITGILGVDTLDKIRERLNIF